MQFEIGGISYRCKSNFYCYLTSDDASSDNPVEIKITKSNMEVIPPKSSSCSVSLQTYSALVARITQEHEETGVASESQLKENATFKECAA